MEFLVNYLQAYLPLKCALIAAVFILIISVVMAASGVNFILKKYFTLILKRFFKSTYSQFAQMLVNCHFLDHLSHLGPGLVCYFSSDLFIYHHLPLSLLMANFIKRFSMVYILFVLMACATLLIECLANAYRIFRNYQQDISGYVRIAKIFIWMITGIIAISIVLNKSPWALVTGVGAISAVLLLVFKDSLLGLVASIQVTAYNMLSPGDWIEVPKYGVDGTVLSMSINTVKVENWDKTTVTIPTYALTTEGVKNWRSMNEAGGRRIKRALNIDMDSVKFCDASLLAKLAQLDLLAPFINKRDHAIVEFNTTQGINTEIIGNGRQLTNLGLFRAYIERYLKAHSYIHHKDFTLLVRHLAPSPEGLPIEIYAFTTETKWNDYENIQADIFDHLLAIIAQFELKIYQDKVEVNINK